MSLVALTGLLGRTTTSAAETTTFSWISLMGILRPVVLLALPQHVTRGGCGLWGRILRATWLSTAFRRILHWERNLLVQGRDHSGLFHIALILLRIVNRRHIRCGRCGAERRFGAHGP